jgi:hypothetical protein
MVSALTLFMGSLTLFAGCGGELNGVTAPAADDGQTQGAGIISGSAVKGPINGGTVTAYAVTNGTMGAELASGTTDSQGNYHISIGDYSGPLMLQVSGGTYTDEATGATVTMAPGDVMTVVMASVSSDATTSAIQITPLTSMAQAMAGNMAGGMTDANIAAANAAISNHFQVSDIIHTRPMNPLTEGAGAGATQDMKNYGMALAAMSQYAKDSGMASPSGVVTLMMNDALDGVLDGMKGNTPIGMNGSGGGAAGSGGTETMLSTAGTSSLATSMEQFMGSGMNKSGVDNSEMQLLMNNLASSDGQLMGNGGMMNGGTGGDMMSWGTGTSDMITGETDTGGMMNGGAGGGMMMGGSEMGGIR